MHDTRSDSKPTVLLPLVRPRAHAEDMAKDSPYKVSMQQLEAVHVAPEDKVEEHDVVPPVPDAKSEGQRDRESLLRIGVPGL